MKILSPMPTGCGAYVLHEKLAQSIDGYQLRPYSPWSTLFPPVLPFAAWGKADIVHTGVDYGIFFKRPGVPLVTTIHGYVSDAFMRPYCSRLQYLHYRTDLRSFVRATLKLADQTVAASQFMIDLIKRDKKAINKWPRFVLIDKIGEVHCVDGQYAVEVAPELVMKVFHEL